MENLRIKYLTDFHLKTMQIGDTSLADIAYYSTTLGSLFEIVISIIILSIYQKSGFGTVIELIQDFPKNTFTYILIITFSLAFKLVLLIGVLSFSKINNVLFKKGILFNIVCIDLCLYVLDSILLGVMIQQSAILISFAAINVFVCVIYRFINEITTFNYSFIYPYPLKKMPSVIYSILIAILQVLFVVFQIRMKGDIIMILFFVVSGIRVLLQFKYFFQIPYLDGKIMIIKILAFTNWICLFITQAGCMVFQIVSDNAVVLYCIIFLFGIIFNHTWIYYVKEKRLVVDIQTAENWEDINIKVQYSYELIFNDNLERLSTISKQHFQKCKILDCRCKWKQINSPIDFRHQVFANKSELFQLKVFLKYYLLVLCQNYKLRFSQIAQAQVVYISALSLLNLYPKLLYHISYFESFFPHQVSFNDKMIVNFLKAEVLEFIEQKNNKDSVLQIERIKKVQQLNYNLTQQIKKISQIKEKIWLSLLQSPVQQQIIQKLFKSEINQREIIKQTYTSITEIPHRKLALWRIMTVYCKNIIQDHNFERIIRKNITKQDLNTKNNERVAQQKSETFARKIEDFLQLEDNYCLMKICTNQKNLGCIQWHNDNFYSMLGFSKTKRYIGQSIDILIPQIYKEYHANMLKQWYQYPKSHKLNRLTKVYMRTNIRQFQSVNLYIKIITEQNDYGVFAILSQNSRQRFIVLNQNLQDILNSNFIKDKLHTKINHPNLILPLLSKDYWRLKQRKTQKFQQHVLKFPLIKNYDQYYEQYCLQVNALQSDLNIEQMRQQKQNILQRISSSISRSEMVDQLQFDIMSKYISVTHNNITKNYIVIKQTIDQESYNDQNEKLIRKKENQSISFNQSSNNFNADNTKTKQKNLLDFQDSQSSISSMKNSTNRDFITKINNSQLLLFQKTFYVCLVVYFSCQFIRLIQLIYFTTTFQQLIVADTSLGTFFQHAEAMYDSSLFNAYTTINTGVGVPFSKSQTFIQLVKNNHEQIILSLQQQSFDISNKYIKDFSSSTINWKATNNQNYDFPTPVWFQSWGLISGIVAGQTALSNPYLQIMKTNYPFLRQAAHRYSSIFLNKAILLTSFLKNVNLSVLPLSFLTIFAILFFLNRYTKQKLKIREDFIKIFTEIDQQSMGYYAQKYKHIEDQFQCAEQQIIQPQMQTGYLNRKVMINKAKPPPLYKLYMFLISLIFVFDLTISISSSIKSDSFFGAYECQSKLKQSLLYQIQSLIQIKQIAMGLRTYVEQHSLKQLNKDGFQQFKDNAIRIFNEFTDKSINSSNKEMMRLLINNLCTVLQPQLPIQLKNICNNQFTLQIFRSGLMTFSHYIVDVLIQQSSNFVKQFGQNKTAVFLQTIKNQSLVDASISSTYRILILQKLQQQILKISQSYMKTLNAETITLIVCIFITLLVFVVFAFFFKKKQYKQWQYIYGSLLIVPQKQLLKASTVSKMIMQLKDKSLR